MLVKLIVKCKVSVEKIKKVATKRGIILGMSAHRLLNATVKDDRIIPDEDIEHVDETHGKHNHSRLFLYFQVVSYVNDFVETGRDSPCRVGLLLLSSMKLEETLNPCCLLIENTCLHVSLHFCTFASIKLFSWTLMSFFESVEDEMTVAKQTVSDGVPDVLRTLQVTGVGKETKNPERVVLIVLP